MSSTIITIISDCKVTTWKDVQYVSIPKLVADPAQKFSLGKTVPDPLASDGGAVFMRASEKANWLIQLNQFPVKAGEGAFQIYAEVRAKFTKPGKKMTAFQWGLYDPRKKTSILLRKISVPEEKNNRYELYYLGENKFRDGQYLWFSQTPDADIFVDRVILVRR